jgi:putative DNA primase/helicase
VDLAAALNATLLGITHFTKGTGGKDTTERVTGSLAFAALARIVLATAKDRESGDFVLTRSKSNIGPDGSGFRYQLSQKALPNFPGVVSSRVEWGEALEGNARELISDAEGDVKSKEAGTAENWLRDLLVLTPMKAVDVYALGKAPGYGERKLQRALNRIGGASEKAGFQGSAVWRLGGDTRPLAELVTQDGMGGDDEL